MPHLHSELNLLIVELAAIPDEFAAVKQLFALLNRGWDEDGPHPELSAGLQLRDTLLSLMANVREELGLPIS